MAEIVVLLRRHSALTQEALAHLTGLSKSMVALLDTRRSQLNDITKIRTALDALGAPPLVPKKPPASADIAIRTPEDSALVSCCAVGQGKNGAAAVVEGLSLSFTNGVLSDSVEEAQTLWRVDVGDESPIHHLAVSADALTTPMLRWLLAPPTVFEAGRLGAVATVGPEHVAMVRRACQLFETLDHEFGGGYARKAAVQYLHSEIAPLLRGRYSQAVGRELFAATAHFAYKVGAMGYDAGLHGLGRRYFVQALNLAHLGADRALAGKALALLSHQANFLGQYRQAVDFARTAKMGTRGQVTPRVYAMYTAMEARALASLGEERECTTALTEMEEAFERSDPAQEPDWLGYFDEAEVHDEFAHCFHDLGRAEPAVRHAYATIELTRREFQRSRTFGSLILAGSHLLDDPGQHDVDHACAVAHQAIDNAGALRSHRVTTYVRRFNDRLAPYAGTGAVKALRERIRPHLDGR